ncbi:MAG: hypothetical protein P8Z67_03635 [Gammaproteobacteria bacterium]
MKSILIKYVVLDDFISVRQFAHMRGQLHNHQEHLQAVLPYAAESIPHDGLDGVIEHINPAAQAWFACNEEAALGASITHHLPEIEQYLDKHCSSQLKCWRPYQ